MRAFIAEQTDDGVSRGPRELDDDELGDGDVVVRVEWSSVNYKDALATIAKGRVAHVDPASALSHPGVVSVLDHTTAPRLDDTENRELAILQDDRIGFRGQIVAAVFWLYWLVASRRSWRSSSRVPWASTR